MDYMTPTNLGHLETQFFAYVQMRRLKTVACGEIAAALSITPQQERELLSRLARRGLIARVRRGLYLVPERLPPGGKWSPGEALALTTLLAERGTTYQITGPNAFYRYGWVDQVPNRLTAYNDRLSGERRIGATSLTLIKVATSRLGATETVTTPGGVELLYSSRSRALMDAVYDWSRFDSLPRGFDWIRAELAGDDRLAAQLVEVTLDYGNQGTIRRIGKLMDAEGANTTLLRQLERGLRSSTSVIPWIPTRPKRGRIDRRWGIVDNDER
jgi:predicted transcriptional regulator of viral defense system